MKEEAFVFDIFISHSSLDKAIARELAQRLKGDGIRVWFDEWEIAIGDNITHKINIGLTSSRGLILLISNNALNSDWATLESGSFLFRDPLNKGRRFIPLKIDDCEVPTLLRQNKYLDWSKSNREQNYPQLLNACKPPPERITNKSQNIARKESRRESRFDPTIPLVASTRSASHFVAAATADGKIGIYKEDDFGTKVIEFQPTTQPINNLCLSNRGKYAAISTVSGEIKLIDWSDFTEIKIRSIDPPRSKISHLNIRDGFLLTSCIDGSVSFSSVRGQTPQPSILRGHSGPINYTTLREDIIFTAGQDSTIRIWDTRTKRCVRILEGHTGSVKCLAVNNDGSQILSGSSDQTIRLWNAKTGSCLHVFEGHTDQVTSVTWLPDSRFFASTSGDLTARIWHIPTEYCISIVDGHSRPLLYSYWSDSKRSLITVDSREFRSSSIDFKDKLPFQSGKYEKAAEEEQVQYTNAKVLLVGESGAGKTGLSRRLAFGNFEPSHSTVGAWATQWALPNTENGPNEREIWLWDFGGQADQRLIHQLYMDDTALAVLVFDGQKPDFFDSLGQWETDLNKASTKSVRKILVAGRIDAGAVRASITDIKNFVSSRGFNGYVETSAKTGYGCTDLQYLITSNINWDEIPWRSSPSLFKSLKDKIISLKGSSRSLMRFNELRDALKLEMPAAEGAFTDDQLRAVLSLLAGPGIISLLSFGGWILFKPELINAYAQAVINTIRADGSELGCINEEKVLQGNLAFFDMERISQGEEKFVLLAMHHQLIEKGLCSKEITDDGVQLVFPSYYRRQRPRLPDHPSLLVSYKFNGFVEDIYSTLVVKLDYTKSFARDQLWQDAADFRTRSGAKIGLKLSRGRLDEKNSIDIFCEGATSLADKIIFIKYVHEHLLSKARDVDRRRHYFCACGHQLLDSDAAEKRKSLKLPDIGCTVCDARIPLFDELEVQYSGDAHGAEVRTLEDTANSELDNESKERVLVGEVISVVALAGQIAREQTVSDHGIDMIIELKNSNREATGIYIYLQLKSGDSHLERQADGKDYFRIKNSRHAEYWRKQPGPVMLIIRNSRGEIKWMDINKTLRDHYIKTRKDLLKLEFQGHEFNAISLKRLRDKMFLEHRIS